MIHGAELYAELYSGRSARVRPSSLGDVVADAMMEWGPDGHCDGHDEIAAVAEFYLILNGWTPPSANKRAAK